MCSDIVVRSLIPVEFLKGYRVVKKNGNKVVKHDLHPLILYILCGILEIDFRGN
jgi:hypothetical protein